MKKASFKDGDASSFHGDRLHRSFLPDGFFRKKLDCAPASPKDGCSPAVYSFAARIMMMVGCKKIITIDGGNATAFSEENSKFKLIGAEWHPNLKGVTNDFPLAKIGYPPESQKRLTLTEKGLRNTVIVCSNVVEHLKEINLALLMTQRLLTFSPVCILTVKQKCKEKPADPTAVQTGYSKPDLPEFRSLLKDCNLNVQFSGYAFGGSQQDSKNMAVAVVQKNGDFQRPSKSETDSFKVVAVMTTYNEEDILKTSVMKLKEQGISTYIIDNWSTDSTYDIVKDLESKGLLEGSERFPPSGPVKYFEYTKLITRIEEVTRKLQSDWFICQDVDEIRESPWENLNLKEAIFVADKMGYNAIDHTVIVFEPIDNGFCEDLDFEEYFKYFRFGERPGHFAQIKDWKNMKSTRVKIAGHVVNFSGRRVFPYKFLLKHYPVRSQGHGEKKIFAERKARFSPEERKRGMHFQYDVYQPGCSFLADPKTLIRFEKKSFNEELLLERLSGIGLRRQ